MRGSRGRRGYGGAGLLLLAALAAGCGGDPAGDVPLSDASVAPLAAERLDAALLTQRTVGPSYVRQSTAGDVVPGSLGCLDDLEPGRLGVDDASATRARVKYDAVGSVGGIEESSSVTSVVVSFASERAAGDAMEAFSVAAEGCTGVDETSGEVETTLEVVSRLVPVKDPVRQEVLVEAKGNVADGVTAPAVGVRIKVGWVDHHLLAVRTVGVGRYAPDITPYFNTARSRLLAVVAGTDPGPGRPVRDVA